MTPPNEGRVAGGWTDTTFDPRKPVMTRCGWAARIICIDRNDSTLPIVALTLARPGHGEGVMCYRADGKSPNNTDLDLVNVKAGRRFKSRRAALARANGEKHDG